MPERQMIEIASPQLSAAIDPYGAELHHLRDSDGRELMTDADPAYWTGHAPILFPIVGKLHDDHYRLDGQKYQMGQHGFARRSLFEVARHDEDYALFQLAASAQTREHYPFEFILELGYRLDGATLLIEARIENRSDGAMPASFGFHPAFAWPLPYGEDRAAHRIVFDADEGKTIEQLANGLIAPEPRESPLDGRELLLRDALFENDALIWNPVNSASVSYGAAQGPTLEVNFPETPRLGIWTKPGARFVCIEPWHGIADPAGFTGDFRDKPGVFENAPGDEWRTGLSVTLEP
jgi:galactose mutarotase-like enzyme